MKKIVRVLHNGFNAEFHKLKNPDCFVLHFAFQFQYYNIVFFFTHLFDNQ